MSAELPRREFRTIAITLLAFLAVVFAVRFSVLFRVPFLEQGDLAVNALQVENAKHFREIYGNYSRFEFNHPGPAFFYAYAMVEAVLFDALHLVPTPGNAHLIAIIGLQLGFLAAALLILRTHVRWRAFLPLSTLAAAVLIGRKPEVLVSVWPPHVLAIPFFCLLCSATSVAAGRLRHFPVMVIAAGFLFHGHVAQALFVGTLGMCALAVGLRRPKEQGETPSPSTPAEGRALAVGTVLAVVFVLPLAIDVVRFGLRGNVAAILGRFSANTAAHLSVKHSLLYFVTYPVASREQDTILTELGPSAGDFLRGHWLAVGAWLLLVVVIPAWVILRRRRFEENERRFFVAASVVLIVAVADCMGWGMAQVGGVRHYNGIFYYGLFFFTLVLAIAWLAKRLEGQWPRGATLTMSVAALLIAAYSLRGWPDTAGERGMLIKAGATTALAESSDSRAKLLVFDRAHWHVAAAVALELTRTGHSFYVLPWWSFMFQPQHDLSRVGEGAERQMDIWWIGPAKDDAISLGGDLALFTRPAPIDPSGTELNFDSGENGFRYLVRGAHRGDFIASSAENNVVTDEPQLLFQFAPMRATKAVRVVFGVELTDPDRTTALADVVFNGETLGRIVIGGSSWPTIEVPAETWNRALTATLEIRFIAPSARRTNARPNYQEWVAWRLHTIRFER